MGEMKVAGREGLARDGSLIRERGGKEERNYKTLKPIVKSCPHVCSSLVISLWA